jgi:hypothetical protein
MSDYPASPSPPSYNLANTPLPIWNRLAKYSYWLTCVSPLAMIVLAIGCVSSPRYGRVELSWWIASWTVWAAAPTAVMLGLVALAWRRYSLQPTRGYVYAKAGILFGVIASIGVFFGLREISELGKSRGNATRPRCQSNLKQLTTATLMYAQDYDERLPLAVAWNDGIQPYHKHTQLLLCPEEENQTLPSYAMNQRLSGVLNSQIEAPDTTVLFFDSIPGRNKAGGRELLPDPPRHSNEYVVSFLYGTVRSIPQQEISNLIWKPILETKPEPTRKGTGGITP